MDGCLHHTWSKQSSKEEDLAGEYSKAAVTIDKHSVYHKEDSSSVLSELSTDKTVSLNSE